MIWSAYHSWILRPKWYAAYEFMNTFHKINNEKILSPVKTFLEKEKYVSFSLSYPLILHFYNCLKGVLSPGGCLKSSIRRLVAYKKMVYIIFICRTIVTMNFIKNQQYLQRSPLFWQSSWHEYLWSTLTKTTSVLIE